MLQQLNASVTVLNSLCKARTLDSPEASKMVCTFFITFSLETFGVQFEFIWFQFVLQAILYEFHFINKVVQKTNIKCLPMSMVRGIMW